MNANLSKLASAFWSAWLFALVAIYPVPHTIALRNLLLVMGLAAFVWHWRATLVDLSTLWRNSAWLATSGWILAALTGWIVIQSLIFAPLPVMALDKARADWLMALLVMGTGAVVAMRNGNASAVRVIVITLSAHIALVVIFQGWRWYVIGSWPFGLMPFADRDYHSSLNGFLIALLVADRLSFLYADRSPLNFSGITAWGLLLFALGADLLLRTRNGFMVGTALVVVAVVVLISHLKHRKRWGAKLVLALGLVILLGVISVRSDLRWQMFMESVAVGIESQSFYWMTSDPSQLPLTPSGRPLEDSAYVRAAWARQAVEAIAREPLGIGFGHDAFGRAIEMKYGYKGFGSSHSGWLDFALANGIPGLALLLALGIAAVAEGWRWFRDQRDGYALLLVFTTFGYLLRCLLDGHLSGWRLTLFTLIVGVLIGTSAVVRVEGDKSAKHIVA